jgi:hypothetical protein
MWCHWCGASNDDSKKYVVFFAYILFHAIINGGAKFRLSDPPITIPVFRLYRLNFLRILEATQSLHRFKLADFEAIQSLH